MRSTSRERGHAVFGGKVHGLTSVPWPGSCHQQGHQHLLWTSTLTQGVGEVADASQLTLLLVPLALQQLLHHVSVQQVLGQNQDVDTEGPGQTQQQTDPGEQQGWQSHGDGTLARTAQPQGWDTVEMSQPQGCGTGGDSPAPGWDSEGDGTATGMGHREGRLLQPVPAPSPVPAPAPTEGSAAAVPERAAAPPAGPGPRDAMGGFGFHSVPFAPSREMLELLLSGCRSLAYPKGPEWPKVLLLGRKSCLG